MTHESLMVNPTQLYPGCILRFHDGEFRVYYAGGVAFRVRLDCTPLERLRDIGSLMTEYRLATIEEIQALILHLRSPFQILAHLQQPIPQHLRTVSFEKVVNNQ